MKGKGWASIVQEQLSPQRKEDNTEENGKSHYLQTVQWQNHLQVIVCLMCHVEVRHSVFCIVRKCQSCSSTWGERRNAFMSDSELQTTPISGWLVFLPLFLRRSHLLFPCSVHQSPHFFIVLPWLCLWPQSMSCEHQLWRSSLERPHFLNTGNSLEVLTLWSARKLEFSKALFKNHRLQVELEFKCFWSDQKSELYLKLSDKWGIVDKVTLKSRQSTAVRKKNRPR